MFDGQDRLYIASLWGNEIVVMDPRTGAILERIGADRGVFGPDDLAFGPDGSLYWTSMSGGHVGKLSHDGSTKTQPVATGTNPITISREGRVYVGLCILGDGMFEIDPSLDLPPVAVAKEAGMLNGFDFGPDGSLYAPVYFEGRVVRINLNSTPAQYQTVASGFSVPSAVKFDSRGFLYGLSQLTGEVWLLNPSTGLKRRTAMLPPGTDNLALDSRDRLYVSSYTSGAIYQILMGAARTVNPGGMILPGGVAVLPRAEGGESVFVADVWTLREFEAQTGKQLSAEESSFAVPSGITSPSTVSAAGRNLVVSSWIGSQVQVWDPQARKVVEKHTNLAAPLDAIRYYGDLVVSELSTHSVIRLNSTGRATLTSSLVVPAGLAASQGDLWVADWATGMVWQIMAAGAPVQIPVAKGLAGPEGLAVDQDGSLLVVESRAGRLARIDRKTGEVTTMAEGLELGASGAPNWPPTWAFNGVAVGTSGAIYVTGDKANVLYRLRGVN
jgi:sugar lactone lactonase YvrE